MKKRIFNILFHTALATIIVACTGGYSFTGADISPDVKTVSIEYFQNRATLVQPSLSNIFTETLRNKFMSQTNLELINYNGDLSFEGEITNYNIEAQAFQGNETAALNRLTISVRVKFTNNLEPTKNFDSAFSRYADFESSQSLSSIEDELIQQICNELIVDIFNKSVANW
ncbi:LPS assembly lipoprotein LptE [Bacteroidales bacterium OttesenSCG-928-I21]|nr:LPS assembly lipoprotein LptE [Bacteroidales bacterium OttesenSCG-928-I21]